MDVLSGYGSVWLSHLISPPTSAGHAANNALSAVTCVLQSCAWSTKITSGGPFAASWKRPSKRLVVDVVVTVLDVAVAVAMVVVNAGPAGTVEVEVAAAVTVGNTVVASAVAVVVVARARAVIVIG